MRAKPICHSSQPHSIRPAPVCGPGHISCAQALSYTNRDLAAARTTKEECSKSTEEEDSAQCPYGAAQAKGGLLQYQAESNKHDASRHRGRANPVDHSRLSERRKNLGRVHISYAVNSNGFRWTLSALGRRRYTIAPNASTVRSRSSARTTDARLW